MAENNEWMKTWIIKVLNDDDDNKKEEVDKYHLWVFFCLSQQQQKLFLPLLKYYFHLWWILSISVEIAYLFILEIEEGEKRLFQVHPIPTKQEFRSTISHCVCRCVLPLLTLTHTHTHLACKSSSSKKVAKIKNITMNEKNTETERN